MKRKIVMFTCIALVILGVFVFFRKGRLMNDRSVRNMSDHKIQISVAEKSFVIDLYDNPTANDLLKQLPLTLTANDYAGYEEKVIRLEAPLSMKEAPKGDNPEIPEVGYYEPGQWIALYYGPIGYWEGKVPLGKIDASRTELSEIPEGSPVTIEKLD